MTDTPLSALEQRAQMTYSVPFDTLGYAKKLEVLGVDPQNAQAQSQLLSEVITTSLSTKQETLEHTATVESRLERKIDNVDKKIDNVKIELERKIDNVDKKIDNVKTELSTKIDHLAAEIRVGLAELHLKMVKWFVATMIMVMGVVLSATGHLSAPSFNKEKTDHSIEKSEKTE